MRIGAAGGGSPGGLLDPDAERVVAREPDRRTQRERCAQPVRIGAAIAHPGADADS